MQADPVTIGIDPSLTGFAICFTSAARPEQHETFVYKSPYRGIERLNDIVSFMMDTITEFELMGHDVVNVAIEAAVMASPSTLPLSELAGLVKYKLFHHFEDNDCKKPLKIPPMTLKKYAAGKGNAKKQEMLLQIYKRWGLEFNDDNAADAYALARLATGVYINKVEEEIMEKISDPKYRD